MIERDFKGYGTTPPDMRWPDGGRFAVSFVLNIEEGAELNIGDGDERNESRHEVRQEVVGVPDLCTASHYEYSTRVAYWRVMQEFERAGLPVTFNVCTRALERSPWIAEDGVRRGVEFMCHSYRWESHYAMTPDEANRWEVTPEPGSEAIFDVSFSGPRAAIDSLTSGAFTPAAVIDLGGTAPRIGTGSYAVTFWHLPEGVTITKAGTGGTSPVLNLRVMPREQAPRR